MADLRNSRKKRKTSLQTSRSTSAYASNVRPLYGDSPLREKRDRIKAKKARIRKRNIKIIIVLLAIILVSTVFYFSTRKNGYEVFVGTKSIGFIKDKKNATSEDIANTVKAQLEKEKNAEVSVNETIKIEKVHVSKKNKNVGTVDYIISKIRDNVTYKVKAAVITVEGNTVAILSNKSEANTILENIQKEYIQDEEEGAESDFVEKVDVVEQFVEDEEILTTEKATEILTSTTSAQKEYVVVSGDNLSKIADSAGMSVNELININPGLTSDLKVGQTLAINLQKPLLSVKTITKSTVTEKEPKTVEYRDDNTKPKSYQKVIQQGKDGQREVTIETVRINGFVEQQNRGDVKITQEPVTEIIVRGTN